MEKIIETNNEEIWITCRDFPYYEVSNLGRVKSKTRHRIDKAGKIHYKKGKILKPYSRKSDQYFTVCLVRQFFKNRVVLIHRLVVIAFLDNVENKPHVNHKNFNRQDNRLENLEWCTVKENVIHAIKGNRRLERKGMEKVNRKATDDIVVELRKIYKESNTTFQSLSEKFNICTSVIRSIIIGKTWKHIPDHLPYIKKKRSKYVK